MVSAKPEILTVRSQLEQKSNSQNLTIAWLNMVVGRGHTKKVEDSQKESLPRFSLPKKLKYFLNVVMEKIRHLALGALQTCINCKNVTGMKAKYFVFISWVRRKNERRGEGGRCEYFKFLLKSIEIKGAYILFESCWLCQNIGKHK